mmetsp:Transcript_77585/g.179897  ORF Transcript_77585/g.179897 Transcript_77585/m.179897 type:complete len:97 (+) Transcript_77585:1334-1624(+)
MKSALRMMIDPDTNSNAVLSTSLCKRVCSVRLVLSLSVTFKAAAGCSCRRLALSDSFDTRLLIVGSACIDTPGIWPSDDKPRTLECILQQLRVRIS